MTGYFGGYSSGEDGLTGLGPAECAAAKQIAAERRATNATSRLQCSRSSLMPRPAGSWRMAGCRSSPPSRTRRRRWPPSQCLLERRAVLSLPAPAEPVVATDYTAARNAFAGAGIHFVPAREVRTAEELAAAADELRPPYVLKALGLLHKSDAGGVVVGIDSRRGAFRCARRVGDQARPAVVLGRGDGRPPRRRRADRRRPVGSAVRSDRPGRHGRHGHGGVARRAGGARPRRRGRGRPHARPAAHRAAARRAPRPSCRRHRRGRTSGEPVSARTPRPTPRSPSSRSIPCSSPRRERPLSTPELSSTARRY